MIHKGTRIYSIKEIEEQIKIGLEDGLISYMSRCPKYIKELIEEKASQYGNGLTNPYVELNFEDRLDLSILHINITSRNVCEVHECGFDQNQVVINRSYSKYFKTCRACKKLFMNEEEWSDFRKTCDSRKIMYKLTYMKD